MTQSAETLLEAFDLGRREPGAGRWLLDRVSLQVRPGERLALIGPTGSGKTLLLRALALLDPLDAGRVHWKGRPIGHDEVPEFRCQAVYLHQRPSLQGDTVEEVLRRPLQLKVHRRRRFDRPALLDILARLDRDESFLARRTGKLSGGEMQIVALLRAMQLEPLLLLLDEPTAALDRAASEAVETVLQAWRSREADRRAFLWVSHDPAQAERVADRTIRMHGGRIAEPSASGAMHG